MTINTTSISSGPYTGTASTDTYVYDFKIQQASEIYVIETDDSGVETTLVEGSDFSVTGVGDNGGGNVVRTAGNLPTDYTLFFYRVTDLTQDADFPAQGAFTPVSHENAFDKLTATVQEHNGKFDLAPHFARNATAVQVASTEIPIDTVDSFLAIGATGLFELAASVGVSTISRSVIGGYLHPVSAAETAASATVADLGYYYGDIRRYGATTGAADNTTEVQDAINQHSHGGPPVVVPAERGARYRHLSTLYYWYDLTNNPNFNSAANQDGRTMLLGQGAPNKSNFTSTEYVGSILEYTGASGTGQSWADSTANESRSVVVRDIGFYANTTGFAVELHYAPQMTEVSNVFIGNNGNGGCWSIEDVWSSSFSNIWCYGNGSGTAVKYDAVDAGGGNVVWTNVNAENCDIGWDLGAAFDSARVVFIKNHRFIACQGRSNATRNLRIRCGVASAHFVDFWSEQISGVNAGIQISDMAGWDDDLDPVGNRNPGLIRFTGGQNSWTGITDDFKGFEIGDDTATETTDSVGNIIIDGVEFGQVGAAADAIRRHNALYNGWLRIENILFHNNGGQYLVVDDEAQYGGTFVKNWDGDGKAVSSWVEESGGSDRSYWLADTDFTFAQLGSGTHDYSNAEYIPPLHARQLAGDVTITLPSSPKEQTRTLFVSTNDTDNLVLDPGTNEINGTTTDISFAGKYATVNLMWDDGRGWIASGSNRAESITQYVQQVPTATTTALESVAHVVNTSAEKIEGAQVFNTTTNLPVWAADDTDGGVWVNATGATAHTPV